MSDDKLTAEQRQEAEKLHQQGLDLYHDWQVEAAIESINAAIEIDGENPEYHLTLARAYARLSLFDKAMTALGEYLRTEPDEATAARYERLFSSAMDEVEAVMIEGMRQLDMPIEQVGKGIQMWLEYRITIGKKRFQIPKPELWAAGLTNAICRVNFVKIPMERFLEVYDISERSLKEKYNELVKTLDIMPADYRYFTGENNPLDKLVEAAQDLDKLYENFLDEEED
ncbi:MAG TPA: tetratricopeptide repeat protein [Anaerolineae bacterium]|nr:tetratricopeptide repeat protein [Anaerolineae bacterium]